jgi:hypothetical protein
MDRSAAQWAATTMGIATSRPMQWKESLRNAV